MKSLLKVLLYIVLINFIVSVGFVGWFTLSTVKPALSSAGISVTDFLFHNKNIPADKLQAVDSYFSTHGKELGEQLANKISGYYAHVFVSK